MADINIKNLADFRRILATPGTTIQCVEHSHLTGRKPADDPFWKPRTIRAVRSKDVQINIEGSDEPSYLALGKASEWVFEGNVATLTRGILRIKYIVSRP